MTKRLYRSRLAILWNSEKFSHSVWLSAGNFIQLLTAFGANLVLVRFIDPEGFGKYAVATASISLLLALISLRVSQQIIRHSNSTYDEHAESLYFNAILQETLLAGVLMGAIMYLTGTASMFNLVLLAALPTRHFIDSCKSFYERAMPYRQLAVIETGVHVTSHVTTVVLVILGMGYGALYLREGMFAIGAIVGLWLVGGMRWQPFRLLRIHEWRTLFRDTRALWLDGVLESGFARLVIIFAGRVGGEHVAGYFFQAQRLAAIPHQLIYHIGSRLAYNWFSRQEDMHTRRKQKQLLGRMLFWPLLVAAIVTVLFADVVIEFIFGAMWKPSADILRAMAGAILFTSMFELDRSYLAAANKTRVLLTSRIFQYGGLIAVIAIMTVATGTVTGFGLGLGVSCAYIAAYLFIESRIVFSR